MEAKYKEHSELKKNCLMNEYGINRQILLNCLVHNFFGIFYGRHHERSFNLFQRA